MAKKSNEQSGGAAFDPAANAGAQFAESPERRRERLIRQGEEIANLRRDLAQEVPAPDFAEPREELLRAAVHELRNQLGAIAGYAEILLADPPPALSREHRALLDAIKSAGAAMLQVVDDMFED
ncbi:MAG: histidine kinase dimerization/phospho-acceptor domain-containing protein [Candidatus Binataceae bacterium]